MQQCPNMPQFATMPQNMPHAPNMEECSKICNNVWICNNAPTNVTICVWGHLGCIVEGMHPKCFHMSDANTASPRLAVSHNLGREEKVGRNVSRER